MTRDPCVIAHTVVYKPPLKIDHICESVRLRSIFCQWTSKLGENLAKSPNFTPEGLHYFENSNCECPGGLKFLRSCRQKARRQVGTSPIFTRNRRWLSWCIVSRHSASSCLTRHFSRDFSMVFAAFPWFSRSRKAEIITEKQILRVNEWSITNQAYAKDHRPYLRRPAKCWSTLNCTWPQTFNYSYSM